MIRRPPRSTPLYSSAASDVYKRQLVISVEVGEKTNRFHSCDQSTRRDRHTSACPSQTHRAEDRVGHRGPWSHWHHHHHHHHHQQARSSAGCSRSHAIRRGRDTRREHRRRGRNSWDSDSPLYSIAGTQRACKLNRRHADNVHNVTAVSYTHLTLPTNREV